MSHTSFLRKQTNRVIESFDNLPIFIGSNVLNAKIKRNMTYFVFLNSKEHDMFVLGALPRESKVSSSALG